MVEPLLIVKLGNVHCQHCGALIGEVRLDASLTDLAEREERARIRRELLVEIAKVGAIFAQEVFPAEAVAYLERALDRICPEEG